MKIVKPSVEFVTPVNGEIILKRIEECGRVCYKSEDKITEWSAAKFVENIIERGHESVLEHCSFTMKFTCDRGVSHEIVRHRIASYSQESTRYCNYANDKFGNEITVIEPIFWEPFTEPYTRWYFGCIEAEKAYFDLIKMGATAQQARTVLPNSLKTEICITMNLREWRHFFKLRCAPSAHPQMREVACKALYMAWKEIPIIFDDIYNQVLDAETASLGTTRAFI